MFTPGKARQKAKLITIGNRAGLYQRNQAILKRLATGELAAKVADDYGLKTESVYMIKHRSTHPRAKTKTAPAATQDRRLPRWCP